jgi:RimJ/RimL family protein N-acetyltransferase
MLLTITTPRLRLRPFEDIDARRIAYLAGDYPVARMCGRVPHPYTMANAYEFIGWITRSREDGKEYSFAVTAPRDGLIGSCGVSRSGDPDESVYELGYWLGMPYWGLGYASEAARAVMDWARDQLGAKAFVAGHYADNPASGHVLRKLGFVPTGSVELFGLARQCVSPATRYVWPDGATTASLDHHQGAHAHH